MANAEWGWTSKWVVTARRWSVRKSIKSKLIGAMLSTAKGASMRSRLGSTSAADAGAAAGRRRTIAITQRIWTPRSLEGPRTRKPDCRCATLYDDPRRLQMTSLWASPPADYSGLDGLFLPT